jgi:hypothetical protein
VALFYSLVPVRQDYEYGPLDLKERVRSRSDRTYCIKWSNLPCLIEIRRTRKEREGERAHRAKVTTSRRRCAA